MAKTDQGSGSKPGQAFADSQTVTHLRKPLALDSQTVSHLRSALGVISPIPGGAVEQKQQTVSHLAKPLGSTGGSQSGSGTQPTDQGSQGADKK